MKKKKTPEQKLKELTNELRGDFARHAYLKEHGGQDPFYPDGVNMNLTRNHIIYDKRQIMEFCIENGFDLPEEYYLPTPEKVANGYMANLEQTERVNRIIRQGYSLTTKRKSYDEQTSFL
jgi:hypothetical protein